MGGQMPGCLDVPDSFIFNGLLPLEMAALPCAGLVSALAGRKLIKTDEGVQADNQICLIY
jgi:hypothetical protein